MIPEGLKTSLNRMREMSVESGSVYHQYVPIITDTTSIGEFGTPILETPAVMNEFINTLVNRIVYTQFMVRYFNNPLQVLEGDRIPLGYAGQEIYINPAKGRKFNVNDFAGLLQKYESDVKVQYTNVNMDLQYPVTVSRHKLKQAFVSWDALNTFVDELSSSLYNGAYIDEFLFTKYLVSNAYRNHHVQTIQIAEPNTAEQAKAFVTQARAMYLNFRLPSSNYNGWKITGGKGRPIITWTENDDVVFLIRNDILAYVDVNVLASAFNIDKSNLMGRIIPIDNFNVYDDDGNLVFDGSSIIGFMGDKSWFRIKRQDMYLDEFYNANNRTWQYYLNLTKMYNYSLFANGIVFCTEIPNISVTGLNYNDTQEINMEVGENEGLDINVVPANATTPIEYVSSEPNVASVTVTPNNNKHIVIKALSAGNTTITATAGDVNTSINVVVTAPAMMSLRSTAKKTSTKTKTKKTTDNITTDTNNNIALDTNTDTNAQN